MLTPQQCESYQQEGYLLVPDLFSPGQLSETLETSEQNAYGKSFPEFIAELKANPDLENELRLPGAGLGMAGPKAEFCDIPTGVGGHRPGSGTRSFSGCSGTASGYA